MKHKKSGFFCIVIAAIGIAIVCYGFYLENQTGDIDDLEGVAAKNLGGTLHDGSPPSSKKLIEDNFKLNNLDDLASVRIGEEIIDVSIHPLELNQFQLPNKSATYLYEKLSEKANNGDPVAARLLSQLLGACSEVNVNSSGHKQVIDLLLEEGRFPAPDSGSDLVVPVEQREMIKQQYDRQFESCRGLTVAQREESLEWAEKAADAGDFIASELAVASEKTPVENKIQLLEKQWLEHGFVGAAESLAVLYSGSLLTSNPKFKPDKAKAYTYFLISHGINTTLAEQKNAYNLTELISEASVFEQLLTGSLTPREHLEAHDLAVQFLRENKNCCKFHREVLQGENSY